MPNKSKQKGDRLERAAVETLNAHGLEAKRVPLSGSVAGFKGDIHFKEQGIPKVMECKSRKSGFKTLRTMLGDSDRLLVKDDRTDPLIVMPFADYCILAGYR